MIRRGPWSLPRRGVTAFPDLLGVALRAGRFEGARGRLEAEFCRRFGLAWASAQPSGRAGFRLLLRALRRRGHRRVYLPALTIGAIPALARDERYEVVFVDVDPRTLSTTSDDLRRAHVGPGVALITHYFGLPADMGALAHVSAELGLTLIEDCAHSPGGAFAGRALGTFGLGGFFSFETRKPLNGLGGGLVATADAALGEELARAMPTAPASRAQDARKLAMTTMEWIALRPPCFEGVAPLLHRRTSREGLVAAYRRSHSASRSGQYRFSDLQAALVLHQLRDLPEATSRRRALAAIYDSQLPGDLVRPHDTPERPHGYYMYVVQHPQARSLGRFLRSRGVDCGIGDEVLEEVASGAGLAGTRQVVAHALELPMYGGLTPRSVERVCAVAREWRR